MEKNQEKKGNKKILFGGIALVVLIVAFCICYAVFVPKAVAGDKNITIEVVTKSEESTLYEVSTNAEYLRQAMEETEGLEFSGNESEYGLMVQTINGETADYNVDGSYWSFFVNGEYCNYGIDEQVVKDGDAFRIVYTTN